MPRPRPLAFLGLPIALAALAVACGGPTAPTTAPTRAPLHLTVLTAARRPVERSFEVSGTVRGRNTAVLTSRIVAGLREVRVHAGDRVRAGQLLAVLEDADAHAAVRRARAELAAVVEGRTESEQAARAAEANARLASTTHARMTRLLAGQAVTQQAFEEAEARLQSSSAEHAVADARFRGSAARIDEARAALASAEATLAYTRIIAPFSGRVIDRRVDPGSQAAPGTPLLVVEQEGALRVEASIDESHASILSLGATAQVEVESAGRLAEGRVTEIVPAVDPASRVFLVKIELPPTPDSTLAALSPGMFARVRFPVGLEERLMVPVQTIRPAGDLDRLFVVEGGHAHLRLVTLGRRQGKDVEILSGLDPGEVVVAAPPPDLLDGTPVEARP